MKLKYLSNKSVIDKKLRIILADVSYKAQLHCSEQVDIEA